MQQNDPDGHYKVTCKVEEQTTGDSNQQGGKVWTEDVAFVDIVPSVGEVMFRENGCSILFVDAAHTCYKGMMIITAVMQDGNGALQIVASCLCPNESDSTYTHFFSLLKDWVVKDAGPPIIISDRHKSIETSVKRVFGDQCVVHTCLVHLLRNVESWVANSVKSVKGDEKNLSMFKKRATYLVNNYARATNLVDSKLYWRLLEKEFPQLIDHLNGLTTVWTRLMSEEKTFGLITSNAVEVINSRMDRAVNLHFSIRDAHIVDMAIQIYSLIQSQVYSRLDKARAGLSDSTCAGDRITPYVMKIIDRSLSSLYHNSIPTGKWRVGGDYVAMISNNRESLYHVDLANSYCECGAWTCLGYPCKHAIAYIVGHKRQILPSMIQLVDKHFLVSTVLKTCTRKLPNMIDPHLFFTDHNVRQRTLARAAARGQEGIEDTASENGSEEEVVREERIQRNKTIQCVADMASTLAETHTPAARKADKGRIATDSILESRSIKRKRGKNQQEQQRKYANQNGSHCSQGNNHRSLRKKIALTEKMQALKKTNNYQR